MLNLVWYVAEWHKEDYSTMLESCTHCWNCHERVIIAKGIDNGRNMWKVLTVSRCKLLPHWDYPLRALQGGWLRHLPWSCDVTGQKLMGSLLLLFGSRCYLIKLHVASKYPTRNDPVLKRRVTVCPIAWVYYVRYSQTVVSRRAWQGWATVLPLNGLFAPTSQRKCNMNSCPAQWKHSFLITCPSHHLLRILDVIVMSWLDLGILTNGKLSVAPTPLHQWSMRRKFLSLWK